MFRISFPLRFVLQRLSIALSMVAPVASAQFVFVGPASDPDCDYHTIQEAVDAWAASSSTDYVDIVIANSQSYPATAITIPTPTASTGVTLRGDMSGCQPGGVTGSAVLDGTGNGGVPVVIVEGSVAGDASRFQVNLSNLEITGGHVAGNGGGVRVHGNATVELFETNVHDNSAANGAGVSVEATAAGVPNLIMAGNNAPAAIKDNDATQDGGGMYCENATLYCDHYCLVAGNTAGRNGGGVAQQMCQSSMYAPRSSGDPDPNVGFRLNSAVGDGGALWVSGGYFWIGGAAPLRPAPVVGNVAGGNGGALYFTGIGSASDQMRGVQFDDNHAGGDGGALFADSGFWQIDAGLSATSCSDIDGCARFRGNHADSVGGAIAFSGSARLLTSNVMFSDNDAAHASVLQIGAAGVSATLTNVHVAGNHGAPELLRSEGGGIDLRYVTIADNGADDDALIRFDAAGGFAASNSLLYDFNGAASGIVVAAPAGTTFFVDCVLVHDDTGLAGVAGVTNLISADPQWDTSGAYPQGLYVPGPDSPAVDACGPGPGTIPDLQGGVRPRDLPKPDGAGIYDMGAIERAPDEVFIDGFEQH